MAAAAHPGPGSTEERRHENQLAPPALGSRALQPVVEQLGALQLQLHPVKHRSTRARERLKQRLLQRREVLMQHRGIIIQNIPGFWAKVFVNHPQMSAMVRDKDQDILSYMINVQVEELEHPHNCYKIMLFFGINPYFSNELIVKEYLSNVNGYSAYHSTPVKWLQDYKREAHSYRYYNNSLSIFNWLADHTFVGSNWIAEIICKDIWLNPLPYYFGAQASGDSIEHPEHFKN